MFSYTYNIYALAKMPIVAVAVAVVDGKNAHTCTHAHEHLHTISCTRIHSNPSKLFPYEYVSLRWHQRHLCVKYCKYCHSQSPCSIFGHMNTVSIIHSINIAKCIEKQNSCDHTRNRTIDRQIENFSHISFDSTHCRWTSSFGIKIECK